jgi:hypothetical protein
VDREHLLGGALVAVEADVFPEPERLLLRVEDDLAVRVIDVERRAEQFEELATDHVGLVLEARRDGHRHLDPPELEAGAR